MPVSRAALLVPVLLLPLSGCGEYDPPVQADHASEHYKTDLEACRKSSSHAVYLKNAREFYVILGKLEAVLVERGDYTEQRRKRMAQYLYKELRGMYRFDRPHGRQLLAKLFDLDPHERRTIPA